MSKRNIAQNNMPELISRLQNEDKKYAQISKRFQFVYIALIPIYLVFIIRLIMDDESFDQILSGVFYLLGMISFALIFRKYYKDYNTINYSEPTLVMLNKAAKRYKPFQRITLLVLIPVVFINAGLSFGSLRYSSSMISIQIIFFGALFFGVSVGLIIWFYRYKSLLDDTQRLISELES